MVDVHDSMHDILLDEQHATAQCLHACCTEAYMLCIPAFQLPVGTTVKINSQDIATSIICQGL